MITSPILGNYSRTKSSTFFLLFTFLLLDFCMFLHVNRRKRYLLWQERLLFLVHHFLMQFLQKTFLLLRWQQLGIFLNSLVGGFHHLRRCLRSHFVRFLLGFQHFLWGLYKILILFSLKIIFNEFWIILPWRNKIYPFFLFLK